MLLLNRSDIMKYISYSYVIRYIFFCANNRKADDAHNWMNIRANQHVIYRHSGIILKYRYTERTLMYL